jgi:hypothetical protein
VQAKARVFLHSHLSPAHTAAAHLAYTDNVSQTVLELVRQAQAEGRTGSVLVMPYGQLTVPVIR